MRLNYKINKTTAISCDEIKLNIGIILKEYGYHIVNSEKQTISFVIDNGLGLNHNQVGKVNKGTFYISDLENIRTLSLEYSIDFVFNFIISAVIIILSFFWGIEVLGLIVVQAFFVLIIIFISKSKLENMIKQIMKSPTGAGVP
jgi:ABC-type bacteriocin/lantibiotic exporter with double-glycine peptidase domain